MLDYDLEENHLVRQNRLLSSLFSKELPPIPEDDERPEHPERDANFFSKIFFWWMIPVMNTGYKRTLTPKDLFTLSDDIKVETMAARFMAIFTLDVERAKLKHVKKKCKKRGETLESSSVDFDTDVEDFKVSPIMFFFTIWKTYKYQYFAASVCLAIANSAQAVNPLLFKKLITYVGLKAYGIEQGVGKGVGYAIGSCLIEFLGAVLFNHFFYKAMMTGAETKGVLTKALLEKSFRLSAESKHKFPVGKITSMMGTDLSRIDLALGLQPFIFVFPIPIVISIAILIVNIGAVALIGIGVMLLFMAVIGGTTAKLYSYRTKANKYTDIRVSYMKEVLNNLKMIKFYSWEPPYYENISSTRTKEMDIIYNMQTLRSIVTALAMSLTGFASLVAFLVLFAVDNDRKNPASIFSSISLFNVLLTQVFMLPMALATSADAFAGVGRVSTFLTTGEVDPKELETDISADVLQRMDKEDVVIEVNNASFEWEIFEDIEEKDPKKEKEEKKKAKKAAKETKKLAKQAKNSQTITPSEEELSKIDSPKFTEKELSTESKSVEEKVFAGLNNINLSIKKNEFVVITGMIGSGKTSLLNALSGFMKKTSGEVLVSSSLLLCGYPWIQNTTVRENIVFGSEWDEEKYNRVIFACSLESDIEILPGGDLTEIGERGITLSGGQKARINLARAVYGGREIILMDDVLSAVDARVGKHIMNNCILDLLKDSTRILATHQLSLIDSADRVIFLNGDGSISVGTNEELQKSNPGFAALMAHNAKTEEDDEDEKIDVDLDKQKFEEHHEVEKELIQRQVTRASAVDEEAIRKDYNKNVEEDGHLIEDEDRGVNAIALDVYLTYVKLGSGKYTAWGIVPPMLVFMALATFCQIFTNTWLSFWTENKFSGKDDNFYIGIYVMFTVLSFVFLALEFMSLVYMTNTAAVKLNIAAVQKVLKVPMAFMDTTPMGRILNRFTKDTDVLDNEIGEQINFALFMLSNVVGIIILCIIYLPWFAIAVPFLGFMFIAVSNYYQASAREIKRLEAVLRSFVYNNFNEVLNGINTINAYKAESRFVAKNDRLINGMNESYYLTIGNQRWLGIQMNIIAVLFSLLIALLCVNRVFKISPASVGLLLSYVFLIGGTLSMLIRTFTQVENEMNSVERISYYSFSLPQEAPSYITENSPPPEWPAKGEIHFKDTSLAYRPGLPLVLKNLNFSIKGSEKIGICGRTGAGKSSIMTALYRLSELDGGSIVIDDIDISTLGLHDLRSKLSIIPQDPVMFRGTIRKNLDPFDQSTDDQLWGALVRTGLVEADRLDVVKAQVKVQKEDKSDHGDNNNGADKKGAEEGSILHKFHLDQMVEDEGVNFSLGERQLIAFARALVRNSKILILDEATSSVDYETDAKIQNSIVNEFADCTILCIAHRLKTIINYDKILVLDKGEIKEFNTPWNLFKTKDSIFQQMCIKSNIVEEDFHRVSKF